LSCPFWPESVKSQPTEVESPSLGVRQRDEAVVNPGSLDHSWNTHLSKEETSMIDHSNSTAALNLVAIDIAKDWNVALIQEPAGRRRCFKFANEGIRNSV
jgi:hypothetical protein